jgi:broad specificity polyphosphatase/5'/3'-nucleotidase SurE
MASISGLWAAAETFPTSVCACCRTAVMSSGAGRSLPTSSDGIIQEHQVTVNGKQWAVHSVGGTPAQTVLHAILEILPEPPALVVAGINYGENLGSGVTISGTVGAALEAASFGIPALAVSLETEPRHHYSHSHEVNFSSAAYFTALFGRILLEKMPRCTGLKIEVPATSPGHSLDGYAFEPALLEPVAPPPSWDIPARVGYHISDDLERSPRHRCLRVCAALGFRHPAQPGHDLASGSQISTRSCACETCYRPGSPTSQDISSPAASTGTAA